MSRTPPALALTALVLLIPLTPGPLPPGPGGARAQGFDALGVSASSQTEYSRSRHDEGEILEEWLDLELFYDSVAGGLRYEAFQPPQREDPLGEEVREGIPFRYLELRPSWGRIRAGNYYVLFGRGLSLNLFEDRDVRIDNNLDGVLLEGAYGGVGLTLLSGRARLASVDRWRLDHPRVSRLDVIHAADVTVSPHPGVLLGATYVGSRVPSADGERVRELESVRSEIWWRDFSLYGEHARLENINTYEGRASYLGGTFSFPGLGITAEYKDYDRFSFHSLDDRTYLNNPPALSREHAYSLLNRHPHQLDLGDEWGYQFEATVAPSYWTSIIVNHSRSLNHDDDVLFQEFYLEFRRDSEERFSNVTGGAAYTEDGATENITLVGEATYTLTLANSLRLEFEHQHTREKANKGEYDNQVVVLEFSRSPRLAAAVSAEWTNKSAVQRLPGEDVGWVMGTVTYLVGEDTDLTVNVGSRQSGFYCAGGRCRFEPAFEGAEVKLISRF